MKTVKYESTPPFPPFQMVIPDGWRIVTGSGKGYKDISFMGPRNKDETLNPAFVVRFTELPPEKIALIDLVDAYLSKRRKLREFKLTLRNVTNIGKYEAEFVELSFSSPKSFDRVELGFMMIYEKRIFFIYKETLCEIILSATESAYLQYEVYFQNAINSMKFAE